MNPYSARSYNVVMIGESFVGKTTIANMLCHETFSTNYTPTIGASMLKIPYDEKDSTSFFYILDTAGMEKYRSLAPAYYRDSSACLLVYDVTNSESFENLPNWYKLYREHASPYAPCLIIGNKIDLEEERKVDEKEGRNFAERNNCQFLEVSAKDGKNLHQIIPLISDSLENVSRSTNSSSTYSLGNENQSKDSSHCC